LVLEYNAQKEAEESNLVGTQYTAGSISHH